MAVLARTDVPVGVQRLVAERAGWAPRGDDSFGALGELPSGSTGEDDA